MTNNDIITTLNTLIETCKDGQDGYKTAADGVKNEAATHLFREYSQQRMQFAAELQDLVRRFGGDPEQSGSLAGALHRGWMNIKATISGGDEYKVFEECERSEDWAVNAYKDALTKPLPPHVQTVVQQQYTSIQNAHDRIRGLRNATKSARV